MASEKDLERAQKQVDKEYFYHISKNYEWLTLEVAKEFHKRADALGTSPNDVGAKRELRKELQEKYGLLEVEALNILNGYHLNAYVEKYRKIKERKPVVRIRPPKLFEEENDLEGLRLGDDW